MSHDSDESLLAKVAAGDQRAFAALYDRMSPRVLGLIQGMLGNQPEAEDALQDAFWYVWRSAAAYDPSLGSAASWILMIGRSRALDRLRQRRRWATTEDIPEPADSPPRADAPQPTAQLTAALAMLPEEQRTAISLAFHRGLTREQIAAAQGVPVGTVKTRIRSGLGRLRQHLQPVTIGDGA